MAASVSNEKKDFFKICLKKWFTESVFKTDFRPYQTKYNTKIKK